MPIKMACPCCGKTLAAPDTAAGKRAKCPACGQIMIVPAPTPQAEDFGTPPAPSSPPTSSADESTPYDLESDSASSQTPPPPGDEARRPCPECGEMIVDGAAKCRFCHAIFDPRLRMRDSRNSRQDGKAIASMVLGIFGLIAWIIPLFGAPINIVGLILGRKAIKSSKSGMATAGVVMSIIGLVLTIISAFIGAYVAAMRR